LGAPALAAAAGELRNVSVTAGPGRVGAATLALDRLRRPARRLARLELQRTVPPSVRASDVSRAARLRLLDHDERRSPRRLRARALPRHPRLCVRAGLETRERLRRAQAGRDVLLRLRPTPRADGGRAPGREWAALPRLRERAGCHTRRRVGRRRARRL